VFEKMDLTEVSNADLKALHEALRQVAISPPNRAALDVLAIIEEEMLRRHQPTEIADYTDKEIGETVAVLVAAVDGTRSVGVSDDYPAVRFMRVNITALVDEMERRGLVHELQ
jgi:hypothetical protein